MGRQETITLKKALDILDTGLPVNLVYVTADENRGTGGDIITLTQWIKCRQEHLTKNPSGRAILSSISSSSHIDDAQNANRLIYNPQTREIKSVHIRLICEFNGKRVI